MTDVEKSVPFSFSSRGVVANQPGAKAELDAAFRDYVTRVRAIDGYDVFRLPGTTEVEATGSAEFSGWTDAAYEFDSSTMPPTRHEPSDPPAGDP